MKVLSPSGPTRFLGSSYEVGPTGTATKYVFAGSQRIAAKDAGDALRFYHGDHLGSSNVITDGTGALVELAEYRPYGALARREGSVEVPQKFTGQRLDATGLYFYNARYYDPALGRFISPDPIVQGPSDPQTLNRYSYVRNNPVRFIDPSGHFFFAIFAAIAAVAKAAVATVSFLASAGPGLFALGKTAFVAASSFAAAHPILTGAAIGGLQGGVSAYRAGGNVLAGIGFGLGTGALTGGLVGPINGSALGFSGLISGPVSESALLGAGLGAISGFGGGVGEPADVLRGALSGGLYGAVTGGTAGVVAKAGIAFGAGHALSSASPQVATQVRNALLVKPTITFLSGAAGAGVGAAISGGDAKAVALGALTGGAFAAFTSGVRVGLPFDIQNPQLPFGLDATFGPWFSSVKSTDGFINLAYQTRMFGIHTGGGIVNGSFTYSASAGLNGTVSSGSADNYNYFLPLSGWF